MADEDIINAVRDRPVLYNKRCHDFKDNKKKAAAWKEVANIAKETSDYVQRRWKLLRDRYARAKKSAIKHSGDEGGPPPTQWELMEAMSFLQGCVIHRKSEMSLKKDTEPNKPRLSLDDSSQCSTQMNVDNLIAGSPDHDMPGECSLGVVEPTASFSESAIVSAQVFDLVPCMATQPITSTPTTDTSNDHEGPSSSKRRPTTNFVRSCFRKQRRGVRRSLSPTAGEAFEMALKLP